LNIYYPQTVSVGRAKELGSSDLDNREENPALAASY